MSCTAWPRQNALYDGLSIFLHVVNHRLCNAAPPRQPIRGEGLVHVAIAERRRVLALLVRAHVVDPLEHRLAECAVVVEVVADPTVDHRVHRNGRFQSRVRIDDAHQREPAGIGDAGDADTAVVALDVLDQPRSCRTCQWSDRPSAIQLAAHEQRHHVVAFAVEAAAPSW
jgi:hypothetical protein